MLTKTVLSAKISIHTACFSVNLLLSTVDIMTKIMAYFEDKTISKKTTAALLLYTQLEHDNKHIMQEQRNLLLVFGLFIIMLSFKQHPVFFLVG